MWFPLNKTPDICLIQGGGTVWFPLNNTPDICLIQGGGTLVVGFSEESQADLEAEYFLLFEGSRWRHLTTAKIIDPYTLHAIIPGKSEHIKYLMNDFLNRHS